MSAMRWPRDAKATAPLVEVGTYLTDGRLLMQVLDADQEKVFCENVATGFVLNLDETDLDTWRVVEPESDGQ